MIFAKSYVKSKKDYTKLDNYIKHNNNKFDFRETNISYGGNGDKEPNEEEHIPEDNRSWTSLLNSACKYVKSTAVTGLVSAAGIITGTAGCGGYYNRDFDGKYTTFYDFNNMEQLNEFLTYVFEVTNEFNKGTLLYYMQMAKIEGYTLPVPKIIDLILNFKFQKSKLLEMIFKKEDVEKYKSILNSTFEPITAADTAIKQFISSLPPHVIQSIKNILDINENVKGDELNQWQSYSTLLSFLGCVLDSKIITYFKPINDMKKQLDDLNLPIRFAYIDAMLDGKFNCSRNINYLYQDFITKRQYQRTSSPIDYLESKIPTYNKMNEMLLKDFFDINKNSLCSLPPTVLFLLLIKINPKINEESNPWNTLLKKFLSQASLTCNINKPSVEEANKKIKELNAETKIILRDKVQNLNREFDLKCLKPKPKSFFNRPKIINNNNKEHCEALDTTIKIINNSITELDKNKQSSILYEKILKTTLKFVGADILVNGICNNNIQWNIFDGLLNSIKKLNTSSVIKFFNFTDNKMIAHSILQSIAGIITFMPIDLKYIFHELLQYRKNSLEEIYFDKIYNEYRIRLYKDFTSPSKSSYHYLDQPLTINTQPLFPPVKLLNKIKEETV